MILWLCVCVGAGALCWCGYLFVCLSVSAWVWLDIFGLRVWVCVSVCMCLALCLCVSSLCVGFFVDVSVCMFVCVWVCVCVCVCVFECSSEYSISVPECNMFLCNLVLFTQLKKGFIFPLIRVIWKISGAKLQLWDLKIHQWGSVKYRSNKSVFIVSYMHRSD